MSKPQEMYYFQIAQKVHRDNPNIKGKDIEALIKKVVKQYKDKGIDLIIKDPPGTIVRHSNGNAYIITKLGKVERI